MGRRELKNKAKKEKVYSETKKCDCHMFAKTTLPSFAGWI